MPQQRKPARLYFRERTDRWIIKDAGREHATGAVGRGARAAAEAALARYLAKRDVPLAGPAQPADTAIADVLARYVLDRGPQLAAPERLRWAVHALAGFWGDLNCDAVIGATCRRYVATRGVSEATARRELGVLQAALRHAHREGLLITTPTVTLPSHGDPRERWLTRDEAAALLDAARSGRNRTLVRFILIGLFTGTRPGAILALRWQPSISSGYMDLERGILHRRGAGERVTKKRRGSCAMPRPLIAHARRWRAMDGPGGEHVIHYAGRPVGNIAHAWAEAVKRAGIDPCTPHVLKHTAVTWFFQRGGAMDDAVDFFSTTRETLERVYRQHSPHFQARAADIMGRKA